MKKRKSTTQNTKKGPTQRDLAKYPALNKGLNTTARRDYIEPDYVDGVKDKDGNCVIRALTDEEKQFLNQFYEESVITNFLHDGDLRKLNKIKRSIVEDELVQQLKIELKRLKREEPENKKRIRELKEIVRITKKQNEETYSEQLEDLEEEMQDLREERLLYPDTNDHKQFYTENNRRNNCLYNKLKITGSLVSSDELEDENSSIYLSREYYDYDEDSIIEDLERTSYEEEEERLKAVFSEEKKSKK